MANELAIRVKVNLDTRISELDKQLDPLKQHYTKKPILLAFGVNQTITKANIKSALENMTKNNQISVPEITLKFKVNNKEVTTQVQAAIREASKIQDTKKDTGTVDATDAVKKKIDEAKQLKKEMNDLIALGKQLSGLQITQARTNTGTPRYEELQRQIESTTKAYNNFRETLVKKLDTEALTELINRETVLQTSTQNSIAVINSSASAYDHAGASIETLTQRVKAYSDEVAGISGRQIDYSQYANTSYFNELLNRYNNYLNDTNLPSEDRYAALRDTVAALRTEFDRLGKEVDNATKKQTSAKTGAERLAKQIQDVLNNTPRLKENTRLYSDFLSLLNKVNGINIKDSLALPNFQKKFASLNKELSILGLNADNTYTKLANLFGEHFQTALVMAGIHGIQQGLQMVISNVSELDHAMTELRKVTDETEQTYNNFLDGASDKARELGTSIADYTNSVAEWAQAGYTFEEADTLAYVATMYKNVGDGINSAADASEYLISILAGFNLQADQAMSVIDKINEVSNRTAVSAQGLGEILSRSAASLAAAGNTIDESLALAAGANRVIQAPERVGNALRSISLFLRAAKTEAEELNIDTEGMASSVSELREDVEAIAGVDIMANADGTQFKSTIDILRELAGVWDDLSDIDQANLTEMLSGKYNANVLSGLLSNFDEVERGLQAALDSTGSAAEENARYLDSVAGKTAQLQASFEQLSNTLLNSGVIKFFLDLGIGATDAANAFAEFAGTLPTLTAALVTLGGIKFGSIGGFEAFSKMDGTINGLVEASKSLSTVPDIGKLFASFGNTKVVVNSADAITTVANALKDLDEKQQSAALSLIKFNGGSKEATQALKAQLASMLGLNSATVGMTTAQTAWNVALGFTKTLLLGLGIGAVVWAIQAAAGAISDYVNRLENANQKATESANGLKEINQNLDTLQTQLDETGEKIAELQSKGTLTITEEEDLKNLEQENKLLEAQIALEKQRQEVARNETEDDANKAIKYNAANVGVSMEDVSGENYRVTQDLAGSGILNPSNNELAYLLAGYQELVKLQKEANDPAQIVEYANQIDEVKEKILEEVDDLQLQKDVLETIGYENLGEEGKEAFDGIAESIETATRLLDKTYYFNISFNDEEFEKGRQKLIDYASTTGIDATSLAVGLETEDWDADITAFVESMREKGFTMEQIAQQVVASIESMGEAASNTSPQLSEMNAKLDELQGAYQTVRTAIDEYNEYGVISADTMQTLVTLHPQYTKCLYDENGQLVINQGTLANTRQSYADMATSIYEVIRALQIKNLVEEIENLNNDNLKNVNYQAIESNDDLVASYGDTTVAVEALRKKMNELASGGASRADLERVQKYYSTQIQMSSEAWNEMMESVYKNTDAQLNYTTKVKDSGNATKDTADKIRDSISGWSDLYEAMKEYNTYGQISYQTANSLLSTWPGLTECLVKEGDQLTINTDKLRDLIETQLAETAAQEESGFSSEEYTRIMSLVSKAAEDGTLTLEELQDAIERVGTAMDEAQSAGDGLASAIQGLADLEFNYDPLSEGLPDRDDMQQIIDAEQALGEKYQDAMSYNPDTKEVELNYEAIKNAVVDEIEAEIKAAEAAGNEISKAMLTATKTAIEAGDKSAFEYWIGLGNIFDYVNAQADSLQQGYQDLNAIAEEYNENGMLSQDSLQKLMTMSPKYLKYLTLEGNALVFNKEGYSAMYEAQMKDLTVKMKDAGVSQEVIDKILEMSKVTEDSDHYFGVATSALEKYKDALSKLGDVFDSVLNLIQQGLDATQDALDDQADLLEIYGNAIIDEIDDRIDALEDLKDQQEQAIQDQIDDLEDLKDAQDDANEELERAIELAKLQDALARARANRTVRKYVEGQGYIWTTDDDAVHDAEQAISDQIRDWNQQDKEDAIQDQIDDLEDQKEQAGDAIDDQIDDLEALKDKYQEVMDLIGMEWDEYQAMLKAQAEANGMTLDEMEANLGDYKDSVVENMKDVDEVTDTQEQIDGIRKFIDTLKEVWTIISTIIEIIDVLTGGSGLMGAIKKLVGNIFGGGDEGEGAEGEDTGGGDIFSGIVDNAKGFFGNIKDIFKNGFDDLITKGKGFFSNFNIDFSGGFGKFGETIKQFFTNAKGVFSGGWENITGTAGKFIQDLASKFTGGFPGILESVTGFFQNLGINFSGGLSSIIQTITGGLGGVVQTVSGFVGNLGGILSNGLGGVIGSLSNMLGGLGGTLASLVSSAGPLLAGAGVVGAGIVANKVVGSVYDYADKKNEEAIENNDILGSIGWGALKGATALASPIDFIKDIFGWSKGTKSVPKSSLYNVDELGPELLIKKAPQGRYTYLEAGDGVVPADITKNLFSIGKDPEEWLKKQLGSNSDAVSRLSNSRSVTSISIGDIIVNKPVGNADQLAVAIKQQLPNKIRQEISKR